MKSISLRIPKIVLRNCLFLIGACLLLCACADKSAGSADKPLASLPVQPAGKWLVINYWATWCKPCRQEVPELNNFARRNAHRAVVLAVNFDGLTGSELIEQARRLGFHTPLLEQDPSTRLGYAPPQVLPTTVLIDPQGAVHEVLVGPQTEDSIRQALEEAAIHGDRS